MPTTSRGYPYPLSTDPPDGAAQIHDLAEAINTDVGSVASRSVPIFPTAAARDDAIQSPTAGQLTYVQDVGRYESWVDGLWLPIAGRMPWAVTTVSAIAMGASTYVTPTTWTAVATFTDFWTLASGVLTLHKPGRYEFHLRLQLNAATGQDLIPAVKHNTGFEFYTHRAAMTSGTAMAMTIYEADAVAGDTITAKFWSSAAITLTGGRWTMFYRGPKTT